MNNYLDLRDIEAAQAVEDRYENNPDDFITYQCYMKKRRSKMKPEILSDEKVRGLGLSDSRLFDPATLILLEAQRDADVKYYEAINEQQREAYFKKCFYCKFKDKQGTWCHQYVKDKVKCAEFERIE